MTDGWEVAAAEEIRREAGSIVPQDGKIVIQPVGGARDGDAG